MAASRALAAPGHAEWANGPIRRGGSVPRRASAKSGSARRTLWVASALLVACGVFMPCGAGMRHLFGHWVAKAFTASAVLLAAHWLTFGRRRLGRGKGALGLFPRAYNGFILFILVHSLLTFTLFVDEPLALGYVGEVIQRDGAVRAVPSLGTKVARSLLYLLAAYAIAGTLRRRAQFVALSWACGGALVLSMALCAAPQMERFGAGARFTGGALNANAFAAIAVTTCLLNVTASGLSRRSTPGARLLCILFALAGVLGVVASASRGAMLGLCVGVLVLVASLPALRRKIRTALVLATLLLLVPVLISAEKAQFVGSRFEPARLQRSHRSIIWRDYLGQLPRYVLTGVGMHRSRTVVEDCYSSHRLFGTHNVYLKTLVEHGLVGLLLLVGGLGQLWRRLWRLRRTPRLAFSACACLGLFTAWLVVFVFGDYSYSGGFVITLGATASFPHWARGPRTWGPR